MRGRVYFRRGDGGGRGGDGDIARIECSEGECALRAIVARDWVRRLRLYLTWPIWLSWVSSGVRLRVEMEMYGGSL